MTGTAIHDFARRLSEAARERRWPNVRPVDAATLIIIDRTAPVPKVLMGKRHPDLKFMPGLYVFPGGRIEAGDRAMVAAGTLPSACEARLMARVQRPSMGRARALGLAAIRETFEETGLMIGSRDYGAPESCPEGPWSEFAAQGVFPELERLNFVARAITPPRRPKRFDTRFFAVDREAVCGQVEGVVGPASELTELRWVTFEEAQALGLHGVTQVVLEELEARIAAGFGEHLPVPFYYELNGRFRREEL